jgi:hypothetical protein
VACPYDAWQFFLWVFAFKLKLAEQREPLSFLASLAMDLFRGSEEKLTSGEPIFFVAPHPNRTAFG